MRCADRRATQSFTLRIFANGFEQIEKGIAPARSRAAPQRRILLVRRSAAKQIVNLDLRTSPRYLEQVFYLHVGSEHGSGVLVEPALRILRIIERE